MGQESKPTDSGLSCLIRRVLGNKEIDCTLENLVPCQNPFEFSLCCSTTGLLIGWGNHKSEATRRLETSIHVLSSNKSRFWMLVLLIQSRFKRLWIIPLSSRLQALALILWITCLALSSWQVSRSLAWSRFRWQLGQAGQCIWPLCHLSGHFLLNSMACVYLPCSFPAICCTLVLNNAFIYLLQQNETH